MKKMSFCKNADPGPGPGPRIGTRTPAPGWPRGPRGPKLQKKGPKIVQKIKKNNFWGAYLVKNMFLKNVKYGLFGAWD